MEILYRWIDGINDVLWSYLLVALLLGCAVWFTLRTRGVQFRMLGEMVRVLGESAGSGPRGEKHVSSFQAFAVSLASRVGTGNLACPQNCHKNPLPCPHTVRPDLGI